MMASVAKVVLSGKKPGYVVTNKSWKATKYSNKALAAALRGSADLAWTEVKSRGKLGVSPWGNVFRRGGAPAARGMFVLQPGFQVERLYTVPKNVLGSWVSIAFDNKGRLIASDQGNKGLCRITLPGKAGGLTKVERLGINLSSAQGMLYAFDSLYVSVNGGRGSGLYRVRDTNNMPQAVSLDEPRRATALTSAGVSDTGRDSESISHFSMRSGSNFQAQPLAPKSANDFRAM